ncbi:hypothetical protein V8F20_011394 [Naviculisporaceae sp. PSN 640]
MARSHRKVKSGCRTCKIRKVKCDEGRPACARCITSGRVCEGYGIWGGGSREVEGKTPVADPRRSGPSTAVTIRQAPPSKPPKIKVRQDEAEWVEWFQSITVVLLQGPYKTSFWNSLVLRAGLDEPSIFHAMLAVGSLHKQITMGIRTPGPGGEPDSLEQFTLRQYNKAIYQLIQPQFTSRDRTVTRTALIACMLFVILEFLRGRISAGHRHLMCGMKLLPGLIQYAGSNRESIDDDLVYIFTRVNMSALKLGHGVLKPTSYFKPFPLPLPLLFKNMSEAREVLDRLTNDILYLEAHRTMAGAEVERQRLKRDLAAWEVIYIASRASMILGAGPSTAAWLGYDALLLPYPVLKIMADTCLREPGDEMIFDAHTAGFVRILTQATRFMMSAKTVHKTDDPVYKSLYSGVVHFTVDLSWSPHLFYTALHCRVRSVRLTAFQLLRAFHMREEIWDSYLVASAAEEVMRMEEGVESLQAFVEEHDPRLIFSGADDSAVLLRDELIPASRRISNVRVALPEEVIVPSVASFACCINTDRGREEITREFPLVSRTM